MFLTSSPNTERVYFLRQGGRKVSCRWAVSQRVKQSRPPERKIRLQQAIKDAEYAALVRPLPQVLRYDDPP